MRGAALPLPLRMIVAWAYCPRLFHYMHVEGVMVANEHVWRGRHEHARTDAPGTTRVRRSVAKTSAPELAGDEAPDPAADLPAEWRETRAVNLGASDLGVIAKLDAVLLDGERTAIPAELKSGSAPDVESPYTRWAAGAWDAGALHVAIQAMALERAGGGR